MTKPTVAIIGASPNREKFGNKSVRAHLAKGYEVFPVHPSATEVEGLTCYPSVESLPPSALDRVSMYVSPNVGLTMIDAIAAREPREFWLNPGSESEALIRRAEELGLNVIVACSIVDLGMMPPGE